MKRRSSEGEGDNGLSGKKLGIDTYGPLVPIGGRAQSGRDFFKADPAGANKTERRGVQKFTWNYCRNEVGGGPCL